MSVTHKNKHLSGSWICVLADQGLTWMDSSALYVSPFWDQQKNLAMIEVQKSKTETCKASQVPGSELAFHHSASFSWLRQVMSPKQDESVGKYTATFSQSRTSQWHGRVWLQGRPVYINAMIFCIYAICTLSLRFVSVIPSTSNKNDSIF